MINLQKYHYWIDYWRLAQDPFTDEPLMYAAEGFDKLLVRYAPINEVDLILEDLEKHKRGILRRRYYIIGLRGMGKTTLFNYIIRTVLKHQVTKKILPIYINNVHVREPEDIIDPSKDPVKLRLNFCLRTIEAIFETVLHTLKDLNLLKQVTEDFFLERRRKYYELKGRVQIDQSSAENLLKEYLNQLRSDFDIFCLLYDELDKIDDYNVVLRFLRSSQGLLESLGRYGCIIFISGVPAFRDTLSTSEYSGVGGHEITIHPWLAEEARLLIKTRLRYAMLAGRIPFEATVIEQMCKQAEGRPRFIQRLARESLVWAAYRNEKTIDESFVQQLLWKRESIEKFLSDFRTSEVLRNAVNTLEKVYNPDRDDATIYFLLLSIYRAGRFFVSSNRELSQKYGIDIGEEHYKRLMSLLLILDAIKKKRAGGKDYYVLPKDLQIVFDHVNKNINESLEYLPRIIRLHAPEVLVPAQKFSLRDETLRILNQNPQKRFGRLDIVRSIIKDPEAKNRALSYYIVSSDRELESKLKAGLPQVLKKAYQGGLTSKFWVGRRNVYQWRTKFVDPEFFEKIRLDEDILRKLESVGQSFLAHDYDGAVTIMRLAVESSLRKLSEDCNVELPEKQREDTLGPINARLFQSKVYARNLHSMIISFKTQADPVVHGRVIVESYDQARVVLDLGKIIIREIYRLKKSIAKSARKL